MQNNPVNWVDPLGLYSFQQFLQETSTFSTVAAAATVFVPGAQGATLVFAGISVVATSLDIALYSKDPLIDSLKESVKMILPVKKPYDMFTDKAVDLAAEKLKEKIDRERQTQEPDLAKCH